MIHVETVPGTMAGENKGGGDEFKCDIFHTL
jgi:hypothetical protein